jgi:hypothetical protein
MQAMRTRTAVGQARRALVAIAGDPLADGFDANAEGRRDGLRRLSLDHHAPRQFGSTVLGQVGILVDVHPVLRGIAKASTTSASSVGTGWTT